MNMIKIEEPLTNNLTSAVREGTSQWKRTFNISGDIFKDLTQNEENLMHFLEGMRGYVKPAAATFMTAFDLSRYQRMCDLGGKFHLKIKTIMLIFPIL
jgi:hypothetical protein